MVLAHVTPIFLVKTSQPSSEAVTILVPILQMLQMKKLRHTEVERTTLSSGSKAGHAGKLSTCLNFTGMEEELRQDYAHRSEFKYPTYR